jgi:hypothetical protein
MKKYETKFSFLTNEPAKSQPETETQAKAEEFQPATVFLNLQLEIPDDDGQVTVIRKKVGIPLDGSNGCLNESFGRLLAGYVANKGVDPDTGRVSIPMLSGYVQIKATTKSVEESEAALLKKMLK